MDTESLDLFERLRSYGNNTMVPVIRELGYDLYSADKDRESLLYDFRDSLRIRVARIAGKPSFRNSRVDTEMLKIIPFIANGYVSRFTPADFTAPVRTEKGIADGIAQRTEEWYVARKKYVTASEYGTVLGYNEYQTPKKYLATKFSDTDTFSEFAYENMNRGTCFEDTFIDLFAYITGSTKAIDAGLIPSPEHDFLAASPDGYIEKLGPCFASLPFEDSLLENKCRNPRSKITGIPKPSYWWQMQLQMHCAQKAQCIFIEGRVQYYMDRNAFLTNVSGGSDRTPMISYESLFADRRITSETKLNSPSNPEPELDPRTIPVQDRFNDEYLATDTGVPKGIVVVGGTRQRDFVYEHVPGNLPIDEQLRWATRTENSFRERGYEDAETKFWYLDDIAWSVIFRDDKRFAESVPIVREFHEQNFPALGD